MSRLMPAWRKPFFEFSSPRGTHWPEGPDGVPLWIFIVPHARITLVSLLLGWVRTALGQTPSGLIVTPERTALCAQAWQIVKDEVQLELPSAELRLREISSEADKVILLFNAYENKELIYQVKLHLLNRDRLDDVYRRLRGFADTVKTIQSQLSH